MSSSSAQGGGITRRLLSFVENTGNRLPDPVTLFAALTLLVMIISWIAAAQSLSVTHPGTGEEISAINLFSTENIRRLFVEMPKTFAGFPPLGLVLVAMLGIGVADKTGLIATALKGFMSKVPASLVTAALVLAGIMSSLAADAGYVVVIPLGAVLFHRVGRHPIAGLAAAFAGVSGGFSANLLLTALDPLLAGFTQSAAQLINPDYVVSATSNYYLMIALTPILTLTGVIVTEKIVEKHLGAYTPPADLEEENTDISESERRGLTAAIVAGLLTVGALALLVLPEGAPLRDAAGDFGPFYSSIVALMLFVFFIPGLVYGIVTKQIKRDRDVAGMTAESMSDMGAYIVLAFVAAHFIAMFSWSNLGSIVAISGANFLESIGFTGIPLLITFILVAAVINIFVGSASAKWAIMAPIFVPMLMQLGYAPELTQAAYRIGDSVTNILTPLLPYFPLIIIFARKYDRETGIGTILSAMTPYSIAFGLVGIAVLIVWILLGLPLGPEGPLHYNPS